MSNWSQQLMNDLLDAGGIFHDTRAKKEQDERYNQNFALQVRALMDQEQAFEYQKDYDAWAKQFAESQDAFSREAFNKQYELAQSPVSTLLNDASKVGVNPMAAMGQSVGSASFSGSSIPSSNTDSSFGVGSTSIPNNIGSMISGLASVGSASIASAQNERDSKRNASLRQQELDIMAQKEEHDYDLGLKNLGVSQQNADTNYMEAIVRSRLADNAERMTDIEFEKFLHNQKQDIQRLALEKAQFEYKKYYDDKEYALKVSQFNDNYQLEYEKMLKAVKTADKDRRMNYITSFAQTVGKLIGDIFFRAMSGR